MTFKKISLVFLTALSAVTGQAFAATEYSVLAYHSVVDESAPKEQKLYLPQTIPATMLIEQFNWLKERGYHVISWQQVLDAEQGKSELPEKAVLLTFDDGYETMYSTIFPLLKAYHYPAVFAPVTSWVSAPAGSQVSYGNQKLDRSAFTTWDKIREMHDSGLVEIASHTHASHYGVQANPAGSQQPAMIAPIYKNGKYETKAQYRARIQNDLQSAVNLIGKYVGQKPRVMVWPYGQFTDTAVNVAQNLGMTHHFSLDSEKVNRVGDKHVGRLLLDAETTMSTISDYLEGNRTEPNVQRVIHVDLDYVYDPNPAQQKKNFDALIERVYRYGVTTVYLQAYADEDGNGVADKLYFPNKYLPVKADLFSQVAWQLMTRAHVKVYAWMPTFAFDLRQSGKNLEYVTDKRTGQPSKDHYLRLSPYSEQNLAIIRDIYNDLAFYAKFNGILFHDDAFLTDFEGKTSAENYAERGEVSPEAKQKTQDLVNATLSFKQALAPYALNGSSSLKTARNMYASVINTPEAEEWFAQSLPAFTKAYDTTAIMAMPYMENEDAISQSQAADWFNDLIQNVKKSRVPMDKVLFEFQAVNWRTNQFIPEKEMISWIKLLERNGITSFGYYPDNFLLNKPNSAQMKPYVSADSVPAK